MKGEPLLNVLIGAATILLVGLVAFLVVFVPVQMYTQAECLRNGYPKYAVTVGLERYCMNLQGTITVRVDKAGAKP